MSVSMDLLLEQTQPNIELRTANSNDVDIIHKMQVEAFLPLLNKYHDYDTSPANETIERIQQKMD